MRICLLKTTILIAPVSSNGGPKGTKGAEGRTKLYKQTRGGGGGKRVDKWVVGGHLTRRLLLFLLPASL